MVFVRSKVLAHRMRVIFGLAGLRVAELHGSLSQAQRLNSLAQFTKGEVDFLICTDLAGRGIDVPGVEAVINVSMPHTLKQYIHRVGRTARAGTEGRSVTLVGEAERKILRQIVKGGEGNLKSRVVAPRVIEQFQKKIKAMDGAIKHVLAEERTDAALDQAEMEATKAQNLLEHRDEILARAPREWIMSGREKEEAAKMSLEAHKGEGGAAGAAAAVAATRKIGLTKTQKKKRKRAAEVENPDLAAAAAAVRAIKRTKRPKKITVFTPERDMSGKGKKKVKKIQGFDSEIKHGQRKQAAGSKTRNAPRPRNKGGPASGGGGGGGGGKPASKSSGGFKSKGKFKRK
jgi:ATP-dependent RNA helicase DDX27